MLNTGTATWDERLLLFLERSGYPEETYHTFSYSPLASDSGSITGMLCVVTEDTQRVLAERRLRTLRDLGAQATLAKTPDEACRMAIDTLAGNPNDIPFALLYMREIEAAPRDNDGDSAKLRVYCRLEKVGAAGATVMDWESDANCPWPVADAVKTGLPVHVPNVRARFGELTGGTWKLPPEEAMVLPIRESEARIRGALVMGISPCQKLDDDYRTFFEMAVRQIATTINSARAYEEEKKRSEALAELDRAKTTFFANVSHEFRTPLTLLLGPVEDAMARSADTEQRDQLELAHRNALRLQKLVNILLDFARIEAGRIQAAYEPTDLAAFTAELASVFRSAVERANMRLLIHYEPLSEPVYVDPDMWEKIVLNLVSNAFKFTLKGEIEVALKQRGGEAILTVRDTGAGIPAEYLPHIFERFHRVEGTQARTHEGTGIGLAMVQELVKLHGGTVGVESVFGQGTTFTVGISLGMDHLPREKIGKAKTSTLTELRPGHYVEEALRWLPNDEHGPGSVEASILRDAGDSWGTRGPRSGAAEGRRILLADDNADLREYLTRLLATRYQVQAVADGEAALAAARLTRPELVLTDVMMPKLDGFALLKELRSDPRTRTTPVIMLSARAGAEARVEGLEAGADDYLIKPFSGRELLARVSSQLELSRVRREADAERERLLKEAQDSRHDAETANRMKDEFLATLSHELRTPLNAILGWAKILGSGNIDAEDLREGVEVIERNSRAQAQLIDDLLDISRIISGKMALDVQRVHVHEVIDAAIAAVVPAAEAKGVRVNKVLDSLAGPVAGDATRIQQIVWNLLANAVKFTPKGGKVQVVLERVNSHVEISVIDTGIGISAEFLPYVFERFRQADGSTTRRHGGLGLGLAIVKQLAEMHGGGVRAKSPGEGQGATFTVSLPIATIAPEKVPPKQLGGQEVVCDHGILAGVRVLVVDDEQDARQLIKRILAECRAEVWIAASAREAMDFLTRAMPDVLVSDIGMPEMDGYDFIRDVRSRMSPKELPAAALTAFARSEDRRRAMFAGFQTHVAKPVDPDELVAVVASLAGRTRTH